MYNNAYNKHNFRKIKISQSIYTCIECIVIYTYFKNFYVINYYYHFKYIYICMCVYVYINSFDCLIDFAFFYVASANKLYFFIFFD